VSPDPKSDDDRRCSDRTPEAANTEGLGGKQEKTTSMPPGTVKNRRRQGQDNDWLALIEPVGQFLTAPVLRETFPQGLPAIPAEVRAAARELLAEMPPGSPNTARVAWIDWLLREGLGWGKHYRTGEEAAAVARDVPEYRTTIKADGLLRDPSDDALRAIVVYMPLGQSFDGRIVGDDWSASPLARTAELARAHGVRIALLTDGERIALLNVPVGSATRNGASGTADEGTGGHAIWQTRLFAEGAEREYFGAFIALLHAQRFFNAMERETPEELFIRSALSQQDLTRTLGLQVRKAVELMIAAFSRANREQGGALLDALPPHDVYEAAATVMMRLVFLLYAEEQEMLPIEDPLYAAYYAISTLRDQLEDDAVRLGDEPLERRATGWRRLLATFNAIYAGVDHDSLCLPPYGGRLFDPRRFRFLERCRVDDLTTRAILTSLQVVQLGTEARRLSFRALDVEQIGHVYEGLLDHDAVRVSEVFLGFDGKSGAESEIALAEIERVAQSGSSDLTAFLVEKLGRTKNSVEKALARGERVALGDEPELRRLTRTACGGSHERLAERVFPYVPLLRDDLQGLPTIYPDGAIVVTKTRARRDSGTEYTPRVLAEEIVRYALESLVYLPGPIDGAARDTWVVKPSATLLNLKVCDPACGSGAFLVATCRYLAERVSEAWQREGYIAEDDPIRDAQRLITERCLYGVDRDPMATEMAKLSLWLLTFAKNRPFGFLDHAIIEGDSLLGITSLDQLRSLHFNLERGDKLHHASLFDATVRLNVIIDESVKLRREIETHATIDTRDGERKAALESEARKRTQVAGAVANALTAAAIGSAELSERDRETIFSTLGDRVRESLEADVATPATVTRLESLAYELGLDRDKPSDAPGRRPLHWPIAFPEVFVGGRSGFDQVIGNPPFLGGKLISGRFGKDYRSFLVEELAGGRRGHADLVAYFFIRAANISMRFAFIATNTIGQGDSREVSLDALLADSWRIFRAERSRIWPGAAAIQVAEVWCAKGHTNEPAVLGNALVSGISALLLPWSRTAGRPFRLATNARIAFIGSYVLGLGFTMAPEEAERLISDERKNADALGPYMSGEDLCDRPDASPRRWIINFQDWSLEKAAEYQVLFDIVEKRVRPERQRRKPSGEYVLRRPLPSRWWQYADKRPGLYQSIRDLEFVIAMPQVSKYSMPLMVRSRIVFNQKIIVFATASMFMFGVLSSNIHHHWVRKWSSTLRSDTNYSPTDCFETFPLPDCAAGIAQIMEELNGYRASLMLARQQGITAIYNRVHDPGEESDDSLKLRTLHSKLDVALLAAYGWQDVELNHDIRNTEEGLRFSISDSARVELLDRLLELNHSRNASKSASSDPVGDSRSRIRIQGNGKRAKRATKNNGPSLLELVDNA
jgi:hypothetical protein